MDYTNAINEYFEKEKRALDSISREDLSNVMNILENARIDGRNIFIMGNGGSAATASHFVCDFNKGVADGKSDDFKSYRFICLNDNIPSMLAVSNDISYDDVFLHQLKTLFISGDVVIGISGSGNSKNVLKAIDYANKSGGVTIGFEGYDGGKLKAIAQYNVHVPVMDMQITEDLHMVFDHCMMKILCNCAK